MTRILPGAINPFVLQPKKADAAAPVVQPPVAPVVEKASQDNTQTLRLQQDVASNIGRAGLQLGGLNKPPGLSDRVRQTLEGFAVANPAQQQEFIAAMQFDLNS